MYAKLRESPSSTESSESRNATRENEAGQKGPESVWRQLSPEFISRPKLSESMQQASSSQVAGRRRMQSGLTRRYREDQPFVALRI